MLVPEGGPIPTPACHTTCSRNRFDKPDSQPMDTNERRRSTTMTTLWSSLPPSARERHDKSHIDQVQTKYNQAMVAYLTDGIMCDGLLPLLPALDAAILD